MALQIEQRTHDGVVVLGLAGTLDMAAATPLVRRVHRAARGQRQLVLDLGQVGEADSVGVAALAECFVAASRRSCRLSATGANSELRTALARIPAPTEEPPPPRPNAIERIGETTLSVWGSIVAFLHLLADTAYWSLIAPLRRRLPPPGATTDQAVRMGVDALPIVALISFLLGLIMAFQAAHQLRQFGANIFVANLVGLAMVRELGPLMTAIVVAGRSGSAIAAELGTMTVGEEIDALRTMGIDPIRFLIVPRVYAISLTQPVLTLFSMAVGVFGGFLIAVLYLDLSSAAYLKQTIQSLAISDLMQGLSKSLVFAWVIVLTGCHYGLRIAGGAVGVGRSTTASVVTSIFAIIVVDSVFTTLSTVLG